MNEFIVHDELTFFKCIVEMNPSKSVELIVRELALEIEDFLDVIETKMF